MPESGHEPTVREGEPADRRDFVGRASKMFMSAGLVGGYGFFAFIAARFLYPANPRERRWMYVTRAADLSLGDSLLYRSPAGETINVTRQNDTGAPDDFIALSSTCPHLGCQVHWEPQNNRYFCPCHNGVFDPAGKGTAGPPGDAGQSLPRYALKVESGLLFIEVPVSGLTADSGEGRIVERAAVPRGAGHDPCLSGECGSARTPGIESDGTPT